jgi:hypothetical protein
MTLIDGDPLPLECEERAALAAGKIRTFLEPFIAENNLRDRVSVSPFIPDQHCAYAEVELVGSDPTLPTLMEIQTQLPGIARGFSGIPLETNIIAGPVNECASNTELYGLPVHDNEMSLYAAFSFRQSNGG